MFPSLFLREVTRKANDDGIFLENGARADIPRFLDPVADAVSCHEGVDYPHPLPCSPLLRGLLYCPFCFAVSWLLLGIFTHVF